MSNLISKLMQNVMQCAIGFLVVTALSSCASPEKKPFQPEYTEPHFIEISNANFKQEVEQYQGYALVLYYNSQYDPSLDMEKRFEYFSTRYGKTIKFCKFHWNIKNDRTPYDLKMLPTVDLYENGYRIDRIKGIPELAEERMNWNDDIDLWLLKNVYKFSGGEYSAEYVYKFKDSAYLNIGNY